MKPRPLLLLLLLAIGCHSSNDDLMARDEEAVDDDDVDDESKKENIYEFLYKRMKQDVIPKKRLAPQIYTIPGPQEPLPGRSHMGDYWPVFPFQNQYSGGVDLDPSISRHIGGDMNIAIPSWGILDIYGRFFNRIADTTTKFGYMNHPVNMMDLEPEDFVKLMSDPSMHYNRNAHPRLPLGRLAKNYVPLNCKPPLCNPYQHTFGVGIEHDFGGSDGVEGDIDVPLPISKGVAYRFPFAGKVYYHFDNITVTYGQNLAPIDPISSLFDYQKTRDPALRIPRQRRSVPEYAMFDKMPQRRFRKIKIKIPILVVDHVEIAPNPIPRRLSTVPNYYLPGASTILPSQRRIRRSVSITPTSISDYGDCYLKDGTSYVLGRKQMGRPICFRCVTAILRSPNILHLAHQSGSTNVEPSSCGGIDGRFAVSYTMQRTNLTCEDGQGTTADNCDVTSRLLVKFRNCSFPDFEMSLRCLGSWEERGGGGVRYVIMQNEENEEYRCGLLLRDGATATVHFANDSSCSKLSVSNSFETYRFRPEFSGKPFSPCQFPKWMRGEFDTLSVTANELQYFQTGVGAVPIISYCVHAFDERVMVYSETKCGEPLGYHCLWFNARSQNLIEFKTTTPNESSNSSTCLEDEKWQESPWTTSVIRKADAYPCGIFGSFSTPSELRTTASECYNVTFKCDEASRMEISAYDCSSGTVYDAREYKCLASWRDGTHLFIFTARGDSHSCFITQYHKGRLYLASTGIQCDREHNFNEHTDTTVVVEESASCNANKPTTLKPKSRKPTKTTAISQKIEVETTTSTTQVPTIAPVESDLSWMSETTSSSTGRKFLICCLFLLYFVY
ncbi:unnamed protein product [Caenorhabditis auriculariae]|uniref:Uncharacterized protein n=1 Tax=Caenorhabditis auriculariae TaxID=2777116 RepID=A0A8S1HVN9_9PELO|nr:unnamed protein product [Caenorhabditis auriculariae]